MQIINELRKQHLRRKPEAQSKKAVKDSLLRALSPVSGLDKPAAGVTTNHWSQPGCLHDHWRKLHNGFKMCGRCHLVMSFKEHDPEALLHKMPAWFKGWQMPPAMTHADVGIITKRVHLRRSFTFQDEWTLLVKFPRGWATSATFGTMQYDKVINAIAPSLGGSSLLIWKKAQKAIYGKVFIGLVQHLLQGE